MMNIAYNSQLIDLLSNKKAIIGIIGLGYVGLPIMQRFAEVGYKAIGYDINEQKIDSLIEQFKHSKTHDMTFTHNISDISAADAICICVPTPLNKNREPDLSYVINAIEKLAPVLRKGQIISLESTTYPGTTEEEIKPRLENLGFKIGNDFFLIYSPERIDPGNKKFAFSDIPKICGGITPVCTEIGKYLYQYTVPKVITVSSTKTAEMTKLLENIYRAVNIGLVNEMKIIADKMGIDIYEVINASATKPFGYVPYYPGPGLGGHCIPIDPFYLTWKAREYGIHTHFIELAGEINSKMPEWVTTKIIDALNQKERPVKNAKILILGLSYKKDIDDIRESPAIEIIKLLKQKNAIVDYSDPYIQTFNLATEDIHLSHVKLTPEIIKDYDCVVVVTDHSNFDYALIQNHAKLIVDTRGIYHKSSLPHVVCA